MIGVWLLFAAAVLTVVFPLAYYWDRLDEFECERIEELKSGRRNKK